jgi:hypothetical protein
MLYSKDYQFGLLVNNGVDYLGIVNVLSQLPDIRKRSAECLVNRVDPAMPFRTTVFNNYWGAKMYELGSLHYNLKHALEQTRLISSEFEMTNNTRIYCPINDPVQRFLDLLVFIKSSGHWFRLLYDNDLAAAPGSNMLVNLPVATRLCPYDVLPQFHPAMQDIFYNATLEEIGERVMAFPFIHPQFDAFRMPQIYYKDHLNRVTYTTQSDFYTKLPEIFAFHGMPLSYKAPPIPNGITASNCSTAFIKKIEKVYAEDVDFYNSIKVN